MEMLPTGYLLFSPTNKCNYRCKHCILDSLGSERKELSVDEIKSIWTGSSVLQKVKAFLVGGEPFFREDIVDISQIIYENSSGINFTTNGFYIDRIKETLEKLKGKPEVTFILSIDGLEKTHDQIRGKGAFNKAIETMLLLKKYNVGFWVNTVMQEANIHELSDIRKFYDNENIAHTFSPLKTFPGVQEYYDIRKIYNPSVIKDVLESLSLDVEKEYVSSLGKLRIVNCSAGFYSCYIDSEGKVYPCLTSQEALHKQDVCMGDLRSYKYNFDNLWYSDASDKVRSRVKKCEGCFVGCELSRELACSPNGVRLARYSSFGKFLNSITNFGRRIGL